MLGFSAAVESQDEVVALVVCGALFAGGLGEEESAPVGDAADDTAGGQDEGAGGSGDFFDLGYGAVWADLGGLSLGGRVF